MRGEINEPKQRDRKKNKINEKNKRKQESSWLGNDEDRQACHPESQKAKLEKKRA